MKSLTVYLSKGYLNLDKHYEENKLTQQSFLFPENFKHPSLQVSWLKSTLDVYSRNDVDNLAIYTNSQCLVNAIGDYIEEVDESLRDKVKVVRLHKGGENVSIFDEDGFLTNWPVGWFCGG